MLHSTRSTLTVSLLAVALLAGAVSLLVGGQLLYDAVLREATNRVRLDLNAAHEIYQACGRNIATALRVTASGTDFQAEVTGRDEVALRERLTRLAECARLDFAGVITADGRTWCRLGSAGSTPFPAGHPLVGPVRARGEPVVGTVVLSPAVLASENPALVERILFHRFL
jgi:two-component system NtrC family sensor kinase